MTGYWRLFNGLSSWYALTSFEFIYKIIGILFFIPILYGVIVFSWRGALFAWLLAIAGVLPVIISFWSIDSILINLFVLLLPFLIATIVTMEIQWRAKEKRLYTEKEFERQTYIEQLLNNQEKDRQRIAQEIHDETIQTLMVISNRAEGLVASSHTDEEAKDINWIKEATLQTIEELRRLSIQLRPQILDHFGLIPAIRWLANNVNSRSDTRVEVKILGEERKLSSTIEVNVFRFVQEALSNIKRHSHARKAAIILEYTDKSLKIKIYDDGCGFQLPERLGSLATKGKLGMIGMEQRIKSIGGTIKLVSVPGSGTFMKVEVKC